MWVDPFFDQARIDRALRSSHRVSSRVELWSEGKPVTLELPFMGGEVTDEWVNGVRRHVSITVPPTRTVLKWLALPQLELRPYRGVQLSRSDLWECPMGRFPIFYPEVSHPVSAITLAADDYWQRVKTAQLGHPVRLPAGSVMNAVEWLTSDAGLPAATSDAPPLATVVRVVIDKSRHDAAMDLARAHDFELFVDRVGQPIVGAQRVLENPATSRVLVGETCVSYKATPDWEKVYNSVSVTSSASGVDLDPQVASVTDPFHPANPWVMGTPGRPTYRTLEWTSPLVRTAAQGMAVAQSVLRKASAKAITYSYECIPDPSRDAGDTILATHRPGSQTRFQIQSVSTPLTVDGAQSITTVSTQPDYSE